MLVISLTPYILHDIMDEFMRLNLELVTTLKKVQDQKCGPMPDFLKWKKEKEDQLKEVCSTYVAGLKSVVESKISETKVKLFNESDVKAWYSEEGAIDDSEDAVELAQRTLLKVDMSVAEKSFSAQTEAI